LKDETSCTAAAVAAVVMYAAGQWDISGLYGAVPLDIKPIDGVQPELYNKMLQVRLLWPERRCRLIYRHAY
jgi:hypothetical protein